VSPKNAARLKTNQPISTRFATLLARGGLELQSGFVPAKLKILVPFDAREALTLREAAKTAGCSETTMKTWSSEFFIGRKIVGQWKVSAVALAMLLDGNEAALVAYLGGHRSGPVVAPYLEQVGLKARPTETIKNNKPDGSSGSDLTGSRKTGA
jgi:hypothetical protein